MNPAGNGIAFVVATKDRPASLARLLASLEAQTVRPAELIVIDGGAESVEALCSVARPFPVRHFRCLPPSSTRQRNAGIDAAGPGMPFIGFLDDDVLLERRAVEEMMKFWTGAEADVGGAAFNMMNHPPLRASRWKSLPVTERLGIYSRKIGAVTRSGFQTMIGTVGETTVTAWLPSGAVVWRREVLDRLRFDEWFSDYGYLEDLDFSYRAAKSFILKVVARAGYTHHPQPSSGPDPSRFGRKEVANRLYFVRKNPELSAGLCRLTLCLRMLMSLADGIFHGDGKELSRARGNLAALLTGGR
jgi:glycosyltransferase involved in cell wall biosynthesis